MQHGSKRMHARDISDGACNSVMKLWRFDATLNGFFADGNVLVD